MYKTSINYTLYRQPWLLIANMVITQVLQLSLSNAEYRGQVYELAQEHSFKHRGSIRASKANCAFPVSSNKNTTHQLKPSESNLLLPQAALCQNLSSSCFHLYITAILSPQLAKVSGGGTTPLAFNFHEIYNMSLVYGCVCVLLTVDWAGKQAAFSCFLQIEDKLPAALLSLLLRSATICPLCGNS